MIRPKTLIYIKLSREPLGVEQEWESENKASVGVWIDSFPMGQKPQRWGQEKQEIQKQPSHRLGWTKVDQHGALKADGSVCDYLTLASVAFPSTEQTFCFSPRTHHDLTASLCPFSTVDCGWQIEWGEAILPKVFALPPRCEIGIGAFGGLFMPASKTRALGPSHISKLRKLQVTDPHQQFCIVLFMITNTPWRQIRAGKVRVFEHRREKLCQP